MDLDEFLSENGIPGMDNSNGSLQQQQDINVGNESPTSSSCGETQMTVNPITVCPDKFMNNEDGDDTDSDDEGNYDEDNCNTNNDVTTADYPGKYNQ